MPLAGFEPATYPSSARRSPGLSYSGNRLNRLTNNCERTNLNKARKN